MATLIILPTQLFNNPKSFWARFSKVIVYEDPYYINSQCHPMKLWFHRATMMEYFKTIPHKNKQYVAYDKLFQIPSPAHIYHPIDKKMSAKYSRCTIMESPMFLMQQSDIEVYLNKSLTQQAVYKLMRIKHGILLNKDETPIGGKWSYDSNNRSAFPKDYQEPKVKIYKSSLIGKSKSIMRLSVHDFDVAEMIYPTTRRSALSHLRSFVKTKLKSFGPYQDALNEKVLIGHHANISAVLNVGLITPVDVLNEIKKHKDAPIASLEGFVRQIIGWREYMRIVYQLYDKKVNHWDYLHANGRIPKSWYTGATGVKTLDQCIEKIKKYAYAHHIERLMLLNNYGILSGIAYNDLKKWFTTMFIDGYDWVMTNVSMNVNSMNPDFKYMKRVYLTNGNYLKKMGLKIGKDEMEHLDVLYKRFLVKHKSLLKSDYVISSQLKRLSK